MRRFRRDGEFVADMIYDEQLAAWSEGWPRWTPLDATAAAGGSRRRGPSGRTCWCQVVRDGQVLVETPSIHDVRARVHDQLAHLHAGIKRFVYPHRYPAGLDHRLYDLKSELVLKARG